MWIFVKWCKDFASCRCSRAKIWTLCSTKELVCSGSTRFFLRGCIEGKRISEGTKIEKKTKWLVLTNFFNMTGGGQSLQLGDKCPHALLDAATASGCVCVGGWGCVGCVWVCMCVRVCVCVWRSTTKRHQHYTFWSAIQQALYLLKS